MSTRQLISEAESFFNEGNHGEAIAKLTSAARSNPNDQEQSSIESLIRKISEHVVGNGVEEKNERGIGGSLMNTMLSNSNGSSQTQLGKLALLATIISSTKGSNGFNLGSVMSLFGHGNQQSGSGNQQSGMGASSLSSLATQFFGSNSRPQQSEGNSSGSFSNLASMASSFMNSNSNNNTNNPSSQQQYQEGQGQFQNHNQNKYQDQNPNQNQNQHSSYSALASMASSYLSGSQKPGSQQTNQQGYGQGQQQHGYQQGQEYQQGQGQVYQQQGYQYGYQQQSYPQEGQQQQSNHANVGQSGFSGLMAMAGSFLGQEMQTNSSQQTGYQENSQSHEGRPNNQQGGNFKFSGNFTPDKY